MEQSNINTLPKFDEDEHLRAQITKYIKTMISNEVLTTNQRGILNEYYLYTIQRVRIKSMMNIFSNLKDFAGYVKKDFNRVDKKDIENYLLWLLEQGRKRSTITIRTVIIKTFFKWLYGVPQPDVTKGIRPKNYKTSVDKSSLLTNQEVRAMIEAADNIRDKALIAVLYDGAFRIDELLSAKLKNVIVDDYGIKLQVSGKTGTRTVRLIDSVPYLQAWLNCHRYKNEH